MSKTEQEKKPEEVEARERIKFVYIGRRVGHDGKPAALMVELDDALLLGAHDLPPELERRATWWTVATITGQQKGAPYPYGSIGPGTVLSFEAQRHDDKSLTIWGHTRDLVTQWQNSDQVARWEGLDRGVMQAQSAYKAKKKLAKADILEKRLEMMREAYMGLPASQRAGFLAWIIYRITRGVI